MLFAKVVLGLPVEGPFDYSVPGHLQKKIREGVRVWIQFRNRKKLGYAVKVTQKTDIQHVKPILEIIDNSPVLNKNMLELTRKISDYYACSWGEAIETALPDALRKGKPITADIESHKYIRLKNKEESILIHDLDGKARWDIYLNRIKETLNNGESVIMLLPDIGSAVKAREAIAQNLGIQPLLLYRKQPKELDAWLLAREPKPNIVVGTRSAIFAPCGNLGLVIIDEEQDTVYKQDQVPHYHAREVVFMRREIEGAKLILGSTSVSLESFYLAKMGKIKYTALPRVKDFPQVKIIDMRNERREFKEGNIILSKYLQDSISQVLNSKGKVLLFLNRKGFATFASCRNCGQVLKCPRCNVNLVYHFKENILNCRYCNFKMAPPAICPACNSSYIRYLGIGTEKIESEVSRVFPHAGIKLLDNADSPDTGEADIFISTASIMKRASYNYDLIGILSIDNSLNRIDLRSTEKAFALLSGLLLLTEKKLVIQTHLPNHYSLLAIEKNDMNMFYTEELKQRKQLGFPPYQHTCLVKLRGKKENTVEEASKALFEKLNKYTQSSKTIKIVSLNPGQPPKLRGNFYRQILIKAASPLKISRFLKLHLKKFPHSGIIVTIDMDPV